MKRLIFCKSCKISSYNCAFCSTLPLSHHTILCFGQTALFLFFLAKATLAYLPAALSMETTPLFSFQQAQHPQVFPLKPAPFCTLFAGLGSTNKSALSLLLLSGSCSVLSSVFLLPQTLWQIWQEQSSLSSCSIRLQWVPDAADKLARRGALLAL